MAFHLEDLITKITLVIVTFHNKMIYEIDYNSVKKS